MRKLFKFIALPAVILSLCFTAFACGGGTNNSEQMEAVNKKLTESYVVANSLPGTMVAGQEASQSEIDEAANNNSIALSTAIAISSVSTLFSTLQISVNTLETLPFLTAAAGIEKNGNTYIFKDDENSSDDRTEMTAGSNKYEIVNYTDNKIDDSFCIEKNNDSSSFKMTVKTKDSETEELVFSYIIEIVFGNNTLAIQMYDYEVSDDENNLVQTKVSYSDYNAEEETVSIQNIIMASYANSSLPQSIFGTSYDSLGSTFAAESNSHENNTYFTYTAK